MIKDREVKIQKRIFEKVFDDSCKVIQIPLNP